MKIVVRATWMAVLMIGGLSLPSLAGPPDADSDSDGTFDTADFCSMDPQAPVPCGFDDDNDGYGNHCDGDFTQDGVVTGADAAPMIAALGAGSPSGIGEDMNCDGVVTAADAALFIDQLNAGVPGPSGLPCAGMVPCP